MLSICSQTTRFGRNVQADRYWGWQSAAKQTRQRRANRLSVNMSIAASVLSSYLVLLLLLFGFSSFTADLSQSVVGDSLSSPSLPPVSSVAHPLWGAAAETLTGHTSLLGTDAVVAKKVKIPNAQLHRQRVGLSPATQLFNGDDYIDVGEEPELVGEDGYFAEDDNEMAEVAVPEEQTKTKSFRQFGRAFGKRLGLPFLVLEQSSSSGETNLKAKKTSSSPAREEPVFVRIPEKVESLFEETASSASSSEDEDSRIAAVVSVVEVGGKTLKRLRGRYIKTEETVTSEEQAPRRETVVAASSAPSSYSSPSSIRSTRGKVVQQLRGIGGGNTDSGGDEVPAVAVTTRKTSPRHRLDEVVVISKGKREVFLQTTEEEGPSVSSDEGEVLSQSEDTDHVKAKKQRLRNVSARLLVLPVFGGEGGLADSTTQDQEQSEEGEAAGGVSVDDKLSFSLRPVKTLLKKPSMKASGIKEAGGASDTPHDGVQHSSSVEGVTKGTEGAETVSTNVASQPKVEESDISGIGQALLEDALLQEALQQPVPSSLHDTHQASPKGLYSSSRFQQQRRPFRRVG